MSFVIITIKCHEVPSRLQANSLSIQKLVVPFLTPLQFSKNLLFSSRCNILSGVSNVNKDTRSSEKTELRKMTGLILKDRRSGKGWLGVSYKDE